MTPNIQIARKNIIPTTQEMKNKKRPKPSPNTKQKIETNNKENELNKPHDPNSMDREVEAGISLILRFIQNSQLKRSNSQNLQVFKEKLFKDIVEFYTGHWYPDRPMKGSAFRCLRINQNGSESLIEKSAKKCEADWIVTSLPKEFTVWIDPSEVSYRIGEEGSICVHYASKLNTAKS